jgi:hypothetical protein
MSMTSVASAVYQTKRPDEVRPPAGRQEELQTPELLAGYLAKIGRDRLLTLERRSPSPGEHEPETKEPAKSS